MSEKKLIRVLVVEDHAVVREGLCSLLTARYGVEVVGAASDGSEAIEKVKALQPDVILMDLAMPRMTGLEAILKIREREPNARIIVLTSFSEDSKVSAAIRSGAMGFLLKDSGIDDLVQAIQSVYSGNLYLPHGLAQKLLASSPGTEANRAHPVELTKRELEVLQYLAQGISNAEIAHSLGVSVATVQSHVHNLLAKLNLMSRTQAALYAIGIGLVTPKN